MNEKLGQAEMFVLVFFLKGEKNKKVGRKLQIM